MIKKLFVIALLALVAYCYWPRHPDLLAYQPREMAALQIQAARQAGGKQWVAYAVTSFKIHTGQYGFPPLTAAGIAMDSSRAVSLYRSSVDETDKEEALKPLTSAYETIKAQTGKTYDPKAVAQLEMKTWSLLKEEAKNEVIAANMSEEMALIYGGPPKKYLEPAQFFTAALKETQASSWPAAQQNLQKGWADLQRVARSK